jgi:hypothetical protein
MTVFNWSTFSTMKNQQFLSIFKQILKLHKKIDKTPFNPQTIQIKKKFQNPQNSLTEALDYISKLKILTKDGLPNSSEKYWNQYYQSDNPIDEWYCDFPIVKMFLPEMEFSKILILGNGISRIPIEMANDEEFKKSKIFSLDISQKACDQMNQLEKLPNIEFICQDVLKMNYENEIDLVLDKGLIDSFWDLNEMDIKQLKTLELKVWNSLKESGVWMVFSVYDLTEIGFLDQQSKELWKSIEDTDFETENEITIHVYKIVK